ncbi:release factor glutamine methyltransferase [Tangfeifania diversioriginum]|uniref:Release factor glutamine methyltransferase n=1 Tax=Tangfeifania diversioriginum TaxID=1168035 RepID=A0A1M6KK30_9BACT|nr:peptide chain release factor N(5)-glutamine methyltransferase [Tangfeifania diversioriginum]SHJ59322.1 release factor glutamine methyltransferase [Tangfeifania diversioriginum]
MEATIQYIEKELTGLYPKTEVQGFVRLIFWHVLQLSYTDLVLGRNQKLEKSSQKRIEAIVERLKKFEPIQYILGETEFFGLKLTVNPSVLIPRPETEELVQWIIAAVENENPSIIDVGTGSGCIALALKKELKNAVVTGVDISAESIRTASKNAEQNQLDVTFKEADILQWEKEKWEPVDVIVSNPPYVRELEKAAMHLNVLQYEPENALFVSNTNPLVFYQSIADFANRYLKETGWLFFEINENLGEELIRLLTDKNFAEVEIKKDINGKDRMLRCRKGDI